MSGDDRDLVLGEQTLSTTFLMEMELDTLSMLYEHAVTRVEDTAELTGVHEEMEEILDEAAERASEELARYGVDLDIEARYNPRLQGGKWADDGAVEVGGPGRCDRPYRLGTEITHEALHGYAEEQRDADHYTAREEGLMQTWNLYYDDVIESEEEREEHLDDVRRVYNEHGSMPEGFGDEIYEYAQRFVAMYEEVDGDPEERMEEVLDTGMGLL
ncbi:MAG: hypothetical protein SV186_05740 [Candidatus Nanohaloarchaea archaeon]|nr:hypothetical protein [Candidatus Nanohaloarchaea archaeon]